MKTRLLIIVISILINVVTAFAQGNENNYMQFPDSHISFVKAADQSDSMEVALYPNPASSEVNIFLNSLLPDQKGELIIYSSSGNQILANSIAFGMNKIYLDNIPNGLYYLRIIRENGVTTTKKLVISRQ